ncbi:hypothetical protein MHU86_19151 [Fragilaria crotonensis]|nr:hypothetical protein MHU86_19151 [Fragilaria crotonensis]
MPIWEATSATSSCQDHNCYQGSSWSSQADNLLPGQQVSIDHFICGTKGRLFSSAGRSLNSDMFAGGCLFIDHASNFVHVEFQKHLNTHETLKAKQNFELMARDSGVIPQSYLSDNGGASPQLSSLSTLEL